MLTERLRDDALRILRAGLADVDAGSAVKRCVKRRGELLSIRGIHRQATVDLSRFERLLLVGGGKAAPAMAEAIVDILGPERITEGAITVPEGAGRPRLPDSVEVFSATHPLPSASAVTGARKMVSLARQATRNDLILFILSGGASAMIPLPAEGITLAEKTKTYRLLINSGATINEINAIRKHISGIKGGQFVGYAHPARVISLIISDVIGDELESIGSGPTTRNTTTFSQCLDILNRHGLEKSVPKRVLLRLALGAQGKIEGPEHIPADWFESCDNIILCNNRTALIACEETAKQMGYRTLNLGSRLFGEASEAAKVIVGIAKSILLDSTPLKPPCCIIAGGELTVTITGNGSGGRNLEFALSAAIHLQQTPGIVALSAGTDGIDGNCSAAGALADGETVTRATAQNMDPADYLKRNDSFTFFDRLGDTIVLGRTNTNVMDVRLVLVAPPNGANGR